MCSQPHDVSLDSRKEMNVPAGRAGVLEHPAGAGEDDDADAGIAQHGQLVGLLQQPSPALGKGHLPVRRVLGQLDLDLPTTYHDLSPT